MQPRRSQPLQTFLVLLLPLMLFAGMWLGGHPDYLPGFLRRAFVADQDTRVVNQALDDLEHDYYRSLSRGQLVNSSISGMVATLDDRFSSYFTPSEYRAYLNQSELQFSGVGMQIAPDPRGLRVVRIFDNSPAAHAHIQIGDLITAADGRSLAGVPEQQATGRIKGRPGTVVTLTIRRDGHTFTRRVVRATVTQPVVASSLRSVAATKLGDVALAEFNPGAHAEVRNAVDGLLSRGARGLVLDLRGNPGGLVDEARLVASIFLADGPIVTTRGRTQPSITLTATGGAIRSSIPVAVLVDRGTASASEIVAGALHDRHRATIVGTQTFGKGVFQEVKPLSNGGALDITVGEYFTPSGRNLGGGGIKRGAGITPDVFASTKPGSHRDTALQLALRTLAAKVR
jgi:carboxyl-terminal processing protease